MRKMLTYGVWFAVFGLLAISCSDEEEFNDGLKEKASLSFGALLNDLLTDGDGIKQALADLPECTDGAPAYVEVALSQNGAWSVGSETERLRVDLNPNPADYDGDGEENYFTEEAAELELEPGTYTLEYFTVHDTNGNTLWMAPREQGDFSGLVDNALPMDIPLGAGVKKYVNVEVLCFDDRLVNEYGYMFFDLEGTEAIEFCVYGNFCDENGRHFPAHFRLDAWVYSGNPDAPMGELIHADLENNPAVNGDGDNYAEPLCFVLPNTSETDQYYIEITLLSSEAYNTEERVIRSGVISDLDVMGLFDGEDNTDFFHFRAGCDDGNDTPPLFSDEEAGVDLQLIADGMVAPLGVVTAPGDTKRLYVIDQVGQIWIIENGVKKEEPFIDLSSNLVTLNPNNDERGLLGLAFHPQYMSNNLFYVYYVAPPRGGGPEGGGSWNNTSRISEFSASDPLHANAGSERIVLEIDQPQANHQGGSIAFGPDGYLYIAIGDGGAGNDVGPGHVPDWYDTNEGGNGQDNEANLLGNILRIDVDAATPYGIPADNPFVDEPGLDEIYAFGFRNPYRFSFDMGGTHQLFVGDAGQGLYEEVSIVENGGNYGWNVKEGTHCFNAANNIEPLADCPDVDPEGNPLIDPVIEMRHVNHPSGGETVVIVGGNVYRGDAIPQFHGQYIFASFANSFTPTGELFIAQPSGAGLWNYHEIELASFSDDIGHFIKGFGQDLEGEIYITASTEVGPTGSTGKLFKLVP